MADVIAVDESNLSMVGGQKDKPPRPTVPPDVKEWTQQWSRETSDCPQFSAAVEQYAQDLEVLFPEAALVASGKLTKKGGKSRLRKDNRVIADSRVFQYSMQTLALLCPGDLSINIEGRNEIPPMGGMTPPGSKTRYPWLDQFALTIEDRLDRHFDESDFIAVLRDFARHCIWFQCGIMKIVYQREIVGGPLVKNRLPDAQGDAQQFARLALCFLQGDFTERDADFQTMKNLHQALAERGEVEVWQNIVGENIPVNRFIVDPKVDSFANMRSAGWMGDLFTLSGEEILSQFAYQPKEDGTWDGVHEDDLAQADPCVSESGKSLVEQAMDRAKRGSDQSATSSKSEKRTGKEIRESVYLIKEIWAAREGNIVFWLIDGVDYPLRIYRPKRQPRGFYPYFTHAINPQPGTWYGRSDTQQLGPIQDRINRKKSDQEIARWLSTGGRGVADVSQIDGKVIDSLRNLSPGEILKANLQGEDIKKALIWLEVPYFKEAFDLLADESDERLFHRMPAAAMGVTDDKTTATAINTANAGSQIAFNDRQFEFNKTLERVIGAAADIVVQEDRPQDVRKESGPNAVWPKVYKESEAKRIEAAVFKRVNDQVTQEVQTILIQTEMAGQDIGMSGEEMQNRIDQRIAELTEAENIKAFGYPEPMTREALFKRVQVKVRGNMNAAVDRERRIMSITQLLQQMIGLGVPINPEPIARLLTNLMGEGDEFGNLFKPDPNQLVAMLAQIAQADPSQISPESAMMVTKMGQMAQQFLMQQGIDPATGQKIRQGQPAAGGATAPAPAPVPAASPQPVVEGAQPQPAAPHPPQAPPSPPVTVNVGPQPETPPKAWEVVRDANGKIIGIAAVDTKQNEDGNHDTQ